MQFKIIYISLLFSTFSIFHLANAFDKTTADIQIKNTLAKWSLSVDSKNYAILTELFTPDAILASPPPTGNFYGLPAIIGFLEPALEDTLSQHSYGTQYTDVVNSHSAIAITYLISIFVGTGPKAGTSLSSHAQYQDTLVLTRDGWRVTNRTLVFMVSGVSFRF